MSYRVTFKGFEELEKKLERVADKSVNICKGMVFTGAGTVADAVRSSLESAVSDEATGELAKSLDIATIKVAGTVYTKVHFTGYDSKGVPNAIKAAVLESGRSDQPNRNKTHFFSKATRGSKNQAIQDMQDKLDRMINSITGD